MVIHENTHMSNIIQTEQIVYLYTYSCMYIRETNTKKRPLI